MIKIEEKTRCSGCTACYAKCPVNAIKMVEDSEGFKYPQVDKKKCVDCGICEKVCPYITEYTENSLENLVAYGGWSKKTEYRKNGTSGGVFSNIAKYVIDNKGIVCGAIYDKNLEVRHDIIDAIEDICKLNGSKYVQSNLSHMFKTVKEYLEENTMILFTGTPCQVTGLLSFLGKQYDNLITIDLACHGVPSPKVYRKYKNYLENKNRSNLKSINFRTKITGWKKYSTYTKYENGKEEIMYASKNPYVRGFLQNVYLRPSCSNCISSKLPRNADITLGDFWGVENSYPELYNNEGTSLILVNSKKGEWLIEKILEDVFIKKCDIKLALKDNKAIISSVQPSLHREKFFKELDKLPFDKLSEKYFPKISIINRIYNKIKFLGSKIIKKINN